ncbi:hypothetical protein VTH82DRAFT_3187 [Thermothelomyces myriococcoides]
MANKPQPATTFPVLIRLHSAQEGYNSPDVGSSDHLMDYDNSTTTTTIITTRAPSSWSSLRPEYPVYEWRSPPPTPLPDPAGEVTDQLMEGIEYGSGETLSPQATTPTVGNEHSADGPVTLNSALPENQASSQTDDLPVSHNTEPSTPRDGTHSSGDTSWSTSRGERNPTSGYGIPLTPVLTPIRKRSPSPPSTPPRPARRRRVVVEASPMDESLDDDDDDDGGGGGGGGDNNISPIDVDFQDLAPAPPVAGGSSEGQLGSALFATPGYYFVSELKIGQPDPNDSGIASYFARFAAQGERVDHTSSGEKTRLMEKSRTTQPRYAIDVECFSEDELEEYFAELLRAYRAFYLEPDEAEQPRVQGDPDRAQRSRRILKTVFEQQLGSAEDEEFLLEEEEEDVLDAFMEWAREGQGTYRSASQESFETLSECLDRLEGWMNRPVAKIIHLYVQAPDGSLLAAHLDARDPDGTVTRKLNEIQDIFDEIGHFN